MLIINRIYMSPSDKITISNNIPESFTEIITGLMLGNKRVYKINYNNYDDMLIREFKTSSSKFRLTNIERNSFILSSDLKDILVGLLLGDLSAKKTIT